VEAATTKHNHLRLIYTSISLLACLLVTTITRAQVPLSGTVYDSSRYNLVEGVKVQSTGGQHTVTDSMGRYSLIVNLTDSVTFSYNGKPTQKFPVTAITDPYHFDIRLHMTIKGKYSTLKEVVVYARSYRQDSIENRETYRDIFGYTKPGLKTGINPNNGVVGADVNEIINIFRFQRNKRLKAFKKRLEQQEEDHYVDYRFNKTLVRRITGIQEPLLTEFMMIYRPTYDFVSGSDEVAFNQYILDCAKDFKNKHK
jgi:hypothetical protein